MQIARRQDALAQCARRPEGTEAGEGPRMSRVQLAVAEGKAERTRQRGGDVRAGAQKAAHVRIKASRARQKLALAALFTQRQRVDVFKRIAQAAEQPSGGRLRPHPRPGAASRYSGPDGIGAEHAVLEAQGRAEIGMGNTENDEAFRGEGPFHVNALHPVQSPRLAFPAFGSRGKVIRDV